MIDLLEAIARKFCAAEPVIGGFENRQCLYCDGYAQADGGFLHDGADEGTCPWVAARRYFAFTGTDGLLP